MATIADPVVRPQPDEHWPTQANRSSRKKTSTVVSTVRTAPPSPPLPEDTLPRRGHRRNTRRPHRRRHPRCHPLPPPPPPPGREQEPPNGTLAIATSTGAGRAARRARRSGRPRPHTPRSQARAVPRSPRARRSGIRHVLPPPPEPPPRLPPDQPLRRPRRGHRPLARIDIREVAVLSPRASYRGSAAGPRPRPHGDRRTRGLVAAHVDGLNVRTISTTPTSIDTGVASKRQCRDVHPTSPSRILSSPAFVVAMVAAIAASIGAPSSRRQSPSVEVSVVTRHRHADRRTGPRRRARCVNVSPRFARHRPPSTSRAKKNARVTVKQIPPGLRAPRRVAHKRLCPGLARACQRPVDDAQHRPLEADVSRACGGRGSSTMRPHDRRPV